jgi:ATPase family associated with various cellular activities (AAA)/AAA lid domain
MTTLLSGPTTRRVAEAIGFGGGDSMLLLYGRGIHDVFVGADYQERSLEEELWQLLRARDFQRIVFCSASDPLYFLDPESVRVSTGRPGVATGARSMRYFAGPQGTAVRVRPAAGTGTTPPSVGRPMLDGFAVKLLSSYMEQSVVRTAVVLMGMENLLVYLGGQRELADRFFQWPRSPTANGNVVLVVFDSTTLEQVTDRVRQAAGANALAAFLDAQAQRAGARSVAAVEDPDDGEVRRLVHVARLGSGPRLRVGDWSRLEGVVAAMAAQRAVSCRAWLTRMRQLAAAGTELTLDSLRERGWVEGSLPDGRSTSERLEELIGLRSVKDRIEALRWQIGMQRELIATGRRTSGAESTALHLVFTGNPGTGKTTVARLIGEIYREIGALRRGHVVDVEVPELIGEYVGHTPVKTNASIDRALDGVLFIDEAYRLSEQPGGFGVEAINTLVSRMENDRRRLVVIVAGYPDKMEQFLRSNPGLRGRFGRANVIDFPDYEPAELSQILFGMLRSKGAHWVADLEPVLDMVVSNLHRDRDETFGNARDMRDLVDQLETRWAARVRADPTKPMQPADVPPSYLDGIDV